MENPDTSAKLKISLKRGDPIKILRHNEKGLWVEAIVVSNSGVAVTVKYPDDGQEVIPWDSGRICAPDSK